MTRIWETEATERVKVLESYQKGEVKNIDEEKGWRWKIQKKEKS